MRVVDFSKKSELFSENFFNQVYALTFKSNDELQEKMHFNLLLADVVRDAEESENKLNESEYKIFVERMTELYDARRQQDNEKEESDPKDRFLDRFHIMKKDVPTGVIDFEVFEYLKQKYPMFVLGGIVYHYDSGVYIADDSGAWLMSKILDLLYKNFKKSTITKRIHSLFLSDIELETSYTELNSYPSHWINFRNGFYDAKEKKLIPHNPKYKAINQIKFDYKPDKVTKGSFLDEWLHFAIPDQEDMEMFLQYSGLCMTKDVSMQKFLLICGEGGTGKSTAIRLNEAVIGAGNISNISLSELNQRFASYGLMGKLMNSCADLEISALEDTSTLKKCLGEDSLRAEKKGADAISFKNYSKLIFSTNELPVIKGERSNGFFRRLLVLNMNRLPRKRDAELFGKLEQDIEHYIHLCVAALERMYEAGSIKESNNSVGSVERMRCDSDSVQAWIVENTIRDNGSRTDRYILYKRYEEYCNAEDRRALSRNSFYKALRSKGYIETKYSGINCFRGIKVEKTDLKNIPEDNEFHEIDIEEVIN